jgi:hypothetical protein
MNRLLSLLFVCFRHFQRPILGGFASHWHLFARRWQHAWGLRLALASIRPALATRSGAASHSGIYSPRRSQHARGLCFELASIRPDVGKTFGGYASSLHSFALALATRSGATLNARILVAIYQFGCRMSNTKISPLLATPDGPVFISSALCREIFHTYGIKFCIDGRIECLTMNWASTW